MVSRMSVKLVFPAIHPALSTPANVETKKYREYRVGRTKVYIVEE